MTDSSVLNPWDVAINATEVVLSNDIYGQMEFDIWFCTLKKGAGKQVFIPGVDRDGERRTAITINIADLGGANYKREFIAEIGNDGWLKTTLLSLRALGVADLQKFNGSYVHAVMVPFGEYTDKNGEKKHRTAPVVKAIYKTREECEAAAQGSAQQTDWLTGNGAPAANGSAAPANDAERQVAVAFLPAIVKSCVRGNGIDSAALDAALKGNPILARHFTLASPEVAQAMASALAEPAF